jgi:hypothetical protein
MSKNGGVYRSACATHNPLKKLTLDFRVGKIGPQACRREGWISAWDEINPDRYQSELRPSSNNSN